MAKTGQNEAMLVGTGTVEGRPVVVYQDATDGDLLLSVRSDRGWSADPWMRFSVFQSVSPWRIHQTSSTLALCTCVTCLRRRRAASNATRVMRSTVSWSGFGLKDHRTKQSCLIRLSEGEATLSEKVTGVVDVGATVRSITLAELQNLG